jgi:hypothetical protein
MHAVTLCVKDARNNIHKGSHHTRRKLSKAKHTARRLFRSRLKAADRNTDFDGFVSPTHTSYDIT